MLVKLSLHCRKYEYKFTIKHSFYLESELHQQSMPQWQPQYYSKALSSGPKKLTNLLTFPIENVKLVGTVAPGVPVACSFWNKNSWSNHKALKRILNQSSLWLFFEKWNELSINLGEILEKFQKSIQFDKKAFVFFYAFADNLS